MHSPGEVRHGRAACIANICYSRVERSFPVSIRYSLSELSTFNLLMLLNKLQPHGVSPRLFEITYCIRYFALENIEIGNSFYDFIASKCSELKAFIIIQVISISPVQATRFAIFSKLQWLLCNFDSRDNIKWARKPAWTLTTAQCGLHQL